MSHTIYIFEHASASKVQPYPPTYFTERYLIVPSIELSYIKTVPVLTNVREGAMENGVTEYWADFGKGKELLVGTSRPVVVHSISEHL